MRTKATKNTRNNKLIKLTALILFLSLLTSNLCNKQANVKAAYNEQIIKMLEDSKETVKEEIKNQKNSPKDEKKEDQKEKKKKEKKKKKKAAKKREKKLRKQYEHYDEILLVMNYLIDERDFTVEGAAGVCGNISAECDYNPMENYAHHFGIFQWDYTGDPFDEPGGDRWKLILRWLDENGYKVNSIKSQLIATFESEDYKMNEKAIETVRTCSDVEESAIIWCHEYERAPGQAEQRRMNDARKAYELYKKTHK